jgi:hypothetical protein
MTSSESVRERCREEKLREGLMQGGSVASERHLGSGCWKYAVLAGGTI